MILRKPVMRLSSRLSSVEFSSGATDQHSDATDAVLGDQIDREREHEAKGSNGPTVR
jgi:hypothetical protein